MLDVCQFSLCLLYWWLARINASLFPIFGSEFEFHLAVYQGKKSMVSTDTDIIAGVYPGSALPDNDGTSRHGLSIISLYTKSL